jgi:PAS domain S-box-containing protein
MQTITDEATQIIGAEGASVELRDGDCLIYRAISGPLAQGTLGLRLNLHKSLAGRAVLERKILRCDDSETDDRVDRLACRRVGLRSMIVTPLEALAGVVGVLKVMSSRPKAFTAEHENILFLLASSLATAIDNAETSAATSQQFVTLTNALPQLVWMANAEGNIYWCNQRCCDYTGLTPEVLNGHGWQMVQDPNLLVGLLDQWSTSIAFGEPFEMQFPLRNSKGTYRWFLTRVNPVKDHSGRVIRWFGASTDIHDQRQYMEALRVSEANFRQLTESLPQMIWTATPDGLIDYYNERWYEFTGIPKSESLGDAWLSLIHPDDQERIVATWQKALQRGDHYEIEVRFRRHADHSYRWILVRAMPARDATGKIHRWIGSNTDIHEQRQAAEQMAHAKIEAENASRLKSAFLANMSHEIRTPLGAILGFTDLLKDPTISDSERQSFLEIVSQNGSHLATVINDILDLSKVESNALKIDKARTSITEVVSAVVTLFGMKAKEKGLALEFTSPERLPDVLTDASRLRQILANIVSNAIKFTHVGRVRIDVNAQDVDADLVNLSISVSDTGVGIPPSSRCHLFSPFEQADNSITRRYGGTGLGLALSKKLAQLLDGDVSLVKSDEGQGSVFQISLCNLRKTSAQTAPSQIERSVEPQSTDIAADAFENLSILLVDDSPDNQHLISRYLKKKAAKVEVASNGVEAVEMALGSSFDLVLMDLSMPVMDGYSATQILRQRGFKQPIIALTAHAMTEVRQKCLNIGCDDHLTKPIAPTALYEAILRHIQRSSIA